jgi:arachidonate 15-lipoxygenase
MSVLQAWADKIITALRGGEGSEMAGKVVNYDYTKLESIALANRVPLHHLPTLEWWTQLAIAIETIVRNTADAGEPPALARMISDLETDASCVMYDTVNLPDVVRALLDARSISSERPSSVKDYDRLFQTIQKPADALHPIEDDVDFARMMVAGPNPVMITRVDEEFVSSLVQHFGDPLRLLKMAQKGRLFVSDYSSLENLPSSTYPNARKYVAAPVAYFTLTDSGALTPVAITLQQSLVSTFIPGDRGWQAAKTAVVASDLTMHEVVSHLAMTHLFIEPFVIATDRRLPLGHPVYRLLKPHFEGTLFINDLAAKVLMAPGGGVDQLTAPTIDATRMLASSALRSRAFSVFVPENDFTRRGVGDTTIVDYPYRDDARLIWNAIEHWTKSYVEATYTSDAAVVSDEALQTWGDELSSEQGGRVFRFVSPQDRDGLARTLATIIFTASAQHAAVNFPQAEMVDVTSLPLAIYANTYTGIVDGVLAMLPPLDQALRQVSLGYLLSSVKLARLGVYEKDHLPDISGPALLKFQADLAQAESDICKRNTTRRPYLYLLPSNIPRSINI